MLPHLSGGAKIKHSQKSRKFIFNQPQIRRKFYRKIYRKSNHTTTKKAKTTRKNETNNLSQNTQANPRRNAATVKDGHPRTLIKLGKANDMKKSLIFKGLIITLLILSIGLAAVGCRHNNTDGPTDDPSIGGDPTDNPGTDNPGTDNPGTDNPGTDNPGTDNPGTDNPGTDNPGTDNPGTDNPDPDPVVVDKSALEAELALAITEQGDYTDDTYATYSALLADARALLADTEATQDAVNSATAALTSARQALTLRTVTEVAGATKEFELTAGDVITVTLSDYFDTKGLSGITFTAVTDGAALTASEVKDGSLTLTATDVLLLTEVNVTLTAYYHGEAALTVTLTAKVRSNTVPNLISAAVAKEYDLYTLAGKESLVIDLSENVQTNGNPVIYTAKMGDEPLTLDGSRYTLTLGKYTDKVTNVTFTVTVAYEGSEQAAEYTYTLALRDTTAYRLANGGFENGLDGWTLVGNIGGIGTDTHYWLNDPESAEGYPFLIDGERMFSAYVSGAEERAVGRLTSSPFTVGGAGFITFKVGGMRDGNYVYIDVVDAETKEILARYYNGLWAERTDGVKSGCTLISYKADLSAFAGREVFLSVSDNADSGYGLFFLDGIVTYYASEPDGFAPATPVDYEVTGRIYDLFNGGFELGDVQGWWNNGEIGVVTNADGYWGDNIPYGKDGTYLYTGVESFGADTMREVNRGILTSSVFEIGGTGYVSFMLGGGGNPLCYIEVIDSTTGEILARYRQQAMQDAVLVRYIADLSAYIGRTARIRVVDQATGGWGCVSFDNVVTYYASLDTLPEGLTATDIKDSITYDVENGSFESGNLDGWQMNITEAGSHNTLGWVQNAEIDAGWYTKNDETKDGEYLFTFVLPDDTNCENSKGTLESSHFTLRTGSFVAFKFGGAGGAQNHDVYIELCRADGSVIARFYNDAEGKQNTKMNAYFYQYGEAEVECFFRIVDNSTGDYGCFVVDDFRVNLESAPEGFIPAIQ